MGDRRLDMDTDQIAEFLDSFSVFDEDNSGEIKATELKTVMESLGENPTVEECESMVAEVDLDQSGDIDFKEFLAMMSQRIRSAASVEDLAAGFTYWANPIEENKEISKMEKEGKTELQIYMEQKKDVSREKMQITSDQLKKVMRGLADKFTNSPEDEKKFEELFIDLINDEAVKNEKESDSLTFDQFVAMIGVQ